jgi:hypothetical protein
MSDTPRLGVTQTIAFTAASAGVTNPFGGQTRQLRLVANAGCHIRIGEGAQTATIADPFLSAEIAEIVTVTPGQRIAAIRAASGGLVTATDGTLWVTELA